MEIVGVCPELFRYIQEEEAPEIFLTIALRPDPNRSFGSVGTLARMKPGVTPTRAEADMEAVARSVVKDHHPYRGPNGEDAGYRTTIVPLRDEAFGAVSGVVLLLFVGTRIVLLIAFANVSILLLSRMAGRSREMATRIALGASRGTVIRQMLAESTPPSAQSTTTIKSRRPFPGGESGLLASNQFG